MSIFDRSYRCDSLVLFLDWSLLVVCLWASREKSHWKIDFWKTRQRAWRRMRNWWGVPEFSRRLTWTDLIEPNITKEHFYISTQLYFSICLFFYYISFSEFCCIVIQKRKACISLSESINRRLRESKATYWEIYFNPFLQLFKFLFTSMYGLRSSVSGHTSDVRCLVSCNYPVSGGFLTGSRDKSLKLWFPSAEGVGYEMMTSFRGSTHWIRQGSQKKKEKNSSHIYVSKKMPNIVK